MWNGLVTIWDLMAETKLRSYKKHSGSVKWLAFSPDSTMIASGADDSLVKIWDPTTGAESYCRSHSHLVTGLVFGLSDSSVISTTYNHEKREGIIHLDAAEDVLLNVDGYFNLLARSPNGNLILVDDAGRLRLWDVGSLSAVRDLEGRHEWGVGDATFTPDGRHLVTGSWDNTVKVWNTTSGSEEFTLYADAWVMCVALSPDEKRIVAGTKSGTIVLWDYESQEECLTIRGLQGIVTSVVFTPDGRKLITSSSDGTIRIWDAGPEFVEAP